MNAMSLDSVAMALPALLFSLVGGALVDSVGARSAFLCAAVAYALGAIIFSRLPATGPAEPRQSLSSRVLGQGFRYLVRHRMLLGILGLAAGRNILLAPSLAFLPVFASAFQTGALGLGALAASLAGGRLGGSLLAAVLGDSRHKVRLLLGAGMASGILVVLFAQSRSFGLAVLFLCLSGATQMIYAVVESTILQAVTAREMRGRVAGFLRMTAGLTPVALLPVGYLVDLWGAPQAVSLAGVVAMLLFAVAALACAFRQVRLD
jgi:ENTS family enterobactin (siderophore) exporter